MTTVATSEGALQDFASAEAHLRSLNESELRNWLDRISDEDFMAIHRNHYLPIYINISSLFWRSRSKQQNQRTAIEAAKLAIWSNRYIERYLESLYQPDELKSASVAQCFTLTGHDPDQFASLQRLGKGLVIYSFRFGLYDCLPLQLAGRGLPLTFPLIGPKYRTLGNAIARLRQRVSTGWTNLESAADLKIARNLANIDVVDIESRNLSLNFLDALRKGKAVFAFMEGNHGADGKWNAKSAMNFEFMGVPVTARNGIIRLAAFAGSPMLPVAALMKSRDRGELIVGNVLHPPSGMSSEECDSFAEAATRELYRFFEKLVTSCPEQWAGVSAFHRWRHLPPSENDLANHEVWKADVMLNLNAGRRFCTRDGAVIWVPGDKDGVLIDVENLRSVQMEAWAKPILQALADGGLSAEWIQEHFVGEAGRSEVISLLAGLAKRRLITVRQQQSSEFFEVVPCKTI